MSSHQYVYVMHRLSKVWPGGKEVLKNISLSFLPGAKIGVLGLNGAGKSTLLKIMAGLDTEFNGEAWAADGIKVGYLAQEPELDASMDVTGNVLSCLGEAKELMDRFNEVSARFAEELTDDEMNEVIAEQAELQGENRRHRRLGSRAQGRDRHGCASCAAGRCRRHHAVWW